MAGASVATFLGGLFKGKRTSETGNGHFREAMRWFEQSCRRAQKKLMKRSWIRLILLLVVVVMQSCCWSTCPPDSDATQWHKPVNQGGSAQ